MRKHSKATLAIVLALVFMVAMASTAVAGLSEYAILPAKQSVLIERGDEEEDHTHHFDRLRKLATGKHYRQQLYHRKMLYR